MLIQNMMVTLARKMHLLQFILSVNGRPTLSWIMVD